jgi:hypothetical protein
MPFVACATAWRISGIGLPNSQSQLESEMPLAAVVSEEIPA